MDGIKKIAIVGPESTGKTTLAKELASQCNTVYVPEFARIYLDEKGPEYTQQDIEEIAREQMRLEEQLLKQATKILICDTNLLVIKVWLEYVYGTCPQWIIEEVNTNAYDVCLLTSIDLPWQPDPLRENPHDRNELYNIYLNELQQLKAPFKVIEGFGSQRLQTAINAISSI